MGREGLCPRFSDWRNGVGGNPFALTARFKSTAESKRQNSLASSFVRPVPEELIWVFCSQGYWTLSFYHSPGLSMEDRPYAEFQCRALGILPGATSQPFTVKNECSRIPRQRDRKSSKRLIRQYYDSSRANQQGKKPAHQARYRLEQRRSIFTPLFFFSFFLAFPMFFFLFATEGVFLPQPASERGRRAKLRDAQACARSYTVWAEGTRADGDDPK